jgi:hypothetical protein
MDKAARSLGCVMAVLALLFGSVALAGGARALVPAPSNTILFVHGYNPTSTSTDCGGDFDAMISQLRSQGLNGAMVRVGYYSGDTNCDVNLHSYGNYGDRDSWKEIAKALSSYISGQYTSRGVTVDVVGYSMGGLIVRGAVYGSQKGETGFSAPINVSDGVTLGGPHNGAAWYSNGCFWGQCSQLKPGASDIVWLNGNGNPQGTKATTWTTIGSYNDDVVPWDSAIYMSIPQDHKVVFRNISHTGFIHPNYMHSWAVVNRAGNALATGPGPVRSGVNSNKCVDVKYAGTANGTPVQIYDCIGSVAQVWTHGASGATTLGALGKCLDVSGSSTANGTKVQLWECNDTDAQKWTRGANSSLQAFGKCLDLPNSNTANFTQLQIWDCNGTNAQRWNFG